MGGCYSHGEGKGREGLGSPPGHTLTCPVTRAGSQGVTSPPGSHPTNPQALGAAEPAETQRAGTDQGPLREPPHGQMFLAVFSAEVSLGAARGWLAYQMQVLQVANYVHWTHHWEVLLATQGPPSHTLFPAPGWFKKTKEATYSHLRRMSVRVLHMGPVVAATSLTPGMVPHTTTLLAPLDR